MRESQKKRGAKVELVDEVIELFNQHKQSQSPFLLSSVLYTLPCF